MSTAQKKKPFVSIRQNLVPEQQDLIMNAFPEVTVHFNPSSQEAHSLAAAFRALETDILMTRIGRHNAVVDIGGNWLSHVLRGHVNVHSCCPELSLRDSARDLSRFLGLFQSLGREVRPHVAPAIEKFCDRPNEVVCNLKAEDCFHPATYGLAIQSVYDVGLSNLGKAMASHGLSELYGTFIFTPAVLQQTSGLIEPLGVVFSRTDDSISFSFVGDPSQGYTHSWSDYRALVTSSHVSHNGRKYFYELMENRNGIQFFKLSAPANVLGRVNFTFHRQWSMKFFDHLAIRVFDFSPGPAAVNDLTLSTVIVPSKFFSDLMAYSYGLSEEKLTRDNVYAYCRSRNVRLVINGVNMTLPEPIDWHDLARLSTVVYLHTVAVRFSQNQVIDRVRTNQRALRTRSLLLAHPEDPELLSAATALASDPSVPSSPFPWFHALLNFLTRKKTLSPEELAARLPVAEELLLTFSSLPIQQTFSDWFIESHDFSPPSLTVPSPEDAQAGANSSAAHLCVSPLTPSNPAPANNPSSSHPTDDLSSVPTSSGDTSLQRLSDLASYYAAELSQVTGEATFWYNGSIPSLRPDTFALQTKYLLSSHSVRVFSRTSSGDYITSSSNSPRYDYLFDGDKLVVPAYNSVLDDFSRCSVSDTKRKFLIGLPSLILFQSQKKLSVLESLDLTSCASSYTLVEGVPGCGKTTELISRSDSRDLILTVTRSTAEEIRARLPTDKRSMEVRTLDSYILNSQKNYDVVWLDEALMLHPGEIDFVALLSKASTIYLYGDSHQLGFIPRVSGYHLSYNITTSVSSIELRSLSYRCPLDVATLFSPVYSTKFFSTSPVINSIRILNIANLSAVPSIPDVKYLVFTQEEKQTLAPKYPNVNTIHEVQGQTFSKVFLVRVRATRLALYDSEPHHLVALTRHKISFVYYTTVPDDSLSKTLKSVSADLSLRADSSSSAAHSKTVSLDTYLGLPSAPDHEPSTSAPTTTRTSGPSSVHGSHSTVSSADLLARFNALADGSESSSLSNDPDIAHIKPSIPTNVTPVSSDSALAPSTVPSASPSPYDVTDLRSKASRLADAMYARRTRYAYPSSVPPRASRNAVASSVTLPIRPFVPLPDAAFNSDSSSDSIADDIIVPSPSLAASFSSRILSTLSRPYPSRKSITRIMKTDVSDDSSDSEDDEGDSPDSPAISALVPSAKNTSPVSSSAGPRDITASFLPSSLVHGVPSFWPLTPSSSEPSSSFPVIPARAKYLPVSSSRRFMISCGLKQLISNIALCYSSSPSVVVAAFILAFLTDRLTALSTTSVVLARISKHKPSTPGIHTPSFSLPSPTFFNFASPVVRQFQLPISTPARSRVADLASSILGSDYPTDRSLQSVVWKPVAEIHPEFSNLEYSVVPPHTTDVLCALQTATDLIFPGASTMMNLSDEYDLEHSDLTLNLHDVSVDLSKSFNSVPRDISSKALYLPVLRTAQPLDRPRTQRQALVGLVKRNMNAPELSLPANYTKLSTEVISKFLSTFCIPGAASLLKEYQSQPVNLTRDMVVEWAATFSDQQLRAHRDNIDTSFLSSIASYSLMIKKEPKNKLEPMGYMEYLPLHNIVYHAREVNAIYSSVFRLLFERFQSILRPDVYCHLRKSISSLDAHLNAHLHPRYNYDHAEVDFSKFDKSQTLFCHLVEMEFFSMLGLDSTLLDLWRAGHQTTSAMSFLNGIKAYFLFQRKTGDSTTCFGNTLISMMSLSWVFQDLKFFAAYFVGDDSIFFLPAGSTAKLNATSLIRDLGYVFNLEAKLILQDHAYFCSSFLVRTATRYVCVPDPVKRLERLGRPVPISDSTLRERFTSLADLCKPLDDYSVYAPLSESVSRRYNLKFDLEFLFLALHRVSTHYKDFKTLFVANPDYALSATDSRHSSDFSLDKDSDSDQNDRRF
uniref:Replication protein 1a n=1 Tax=Bemisia tabaci bromo-like virus 3 TaxID=2840003 RepID=A0A8E8FTR9_9BROM|nr:polyprotein [Bemisia tabaci bromo-like virus 3]